MRSHQVDGQVDLEAVKSGVRRSDLLSLRTPLADLVALNSSTRRTSRFALSPSTTSSKATPRLTSSRRASIKRFLYDRDWTLFALL